MTPKEKAKEMVEKYYNVSDMSVSIAKKCAAIAAIEVFNELDYSNENAVIFWSKVKSEIENI